MYICYNNSICLLTYTIAVFCNLGYLRYFLQTTSWCLDRLCKCLFLLVLSLTTHTPQHAQVVFHYDCVLTDKVCLQRVEPAPRSPKLVIEIWKTVNRKETGSSKAGLGETLSPLKKEETR